jgi:hypothetical protein
VDPKKDPTFGLRRGESSKGATPARRSVLKRIG